MNHGEIDLRYFNSRKNRHSKLEKRRKKYYAISLNTIDIARKFEFLAKRKLFDICDTMNICELIVALLYPVACYFHARDIP